VQQLRPDAHSPLDEQTAPTAFFVGAVTVAVAVAVTDAAAVALSIAVALGAADALGSGAATSGVLDAVGAIVTVVVVDEP
jgi:hypothetical protein